ncbi:hypothetical protein GCM10027436_49040 [Actinophytocola sediminis]
MLAVAGPPPAGGGVSVEFKWDGVRAIVAVSPAGSVRAHSRNDRDITRSYPELLALPESVDRPVLLDGELVALDQDGRPSFQRLQQRMHVQAPGRQLVGTVPVVLYVFDLLVDDGHDLTDAGYLERRARLAALELNDGPVRCPPHYLDVEPDTMLAVAAEHGLEGVVSKRVDSRYLPGRRSRAWIKTPLRQTQEVIVGGWTAGGGRRADGLGSLLMGVRDRADGRLRYVGHVGTGFSDRVLRDLLATVLAIEVAESPFDEPVPAADARAARWVRPELVGEVEHRQWTPDNRLRHPSWRGLRPDRRPDEITAAFG